MHQEWQGLRWHGGSSEIKESINASAPMGGQLTNDEDSDGDGGGKVQTGQAGVGERRGGGEGRSRRAGSRAG